MQIIQGVSYVWYKSTEGDVSIHLAKVWTTIL